MKKISFYLTFFFIAFNLLSHAQGEFAPIGAKWHYTLLKDDKPPQHAGYTELESVKDTVINGQQCRKLHRTQYTRPYNSTASLEASETLASYVYSNSDTVFYFNEELGRFLHLYVFNVDVGDTIYYRTPPMFQENPSDTVFRMKITAVKNTNINGTLLKRINHESLDFVSFTDYIEKIGVLDRELFEFIVPTPAIFTFPFVRCYADSEVQFKRVAEIPCDFIDGPTSIDDYSIGDNKLMVYPNPSSGLLHFKIQGLQLSDIQAVEVYDILGKGVKQITFNKNEGIVDVSSLSKGIYLLKLNINDAILSRKIVVE